MLRTHDEVKAEIFKNRPDIKAEYDLLCAKYDMQGEHDIEYYLQGYERPEDTSWIDFSEPKGREVW